MDFEQGKPLAAALDIFVALGYEAQVVLGVGGTRRGGSTGGVELLLGVLAQQFVQIVAVTRAQPDERLVAEPGQGFQRCTRDLRGGGEVKAAAEDRQPHQD